MAINMSLPIIFITGYSRSGTKLMNKILNQSRLVEYVPEFQFFENIWSCSDLSVKDEDELTKMVKRQCNILKTVKGRFSDERFMAEFSNNLIIQIKTRQITTPIELYQQILINASADFPCCIDTTPRNIYYFSEIKKLLPSSKFIYMQRDPRDCILSQKNKYRTYLKMRQWLEATRLWLNYNPLLMAQFWVRSHNIAVSNLKNGCLIVAYEALIEEPEKLSSEIGDFLKVDMVTTDFSYIKSNNTKKWLSGLPSSDIYLIQSIAAQQMEIAGYKVIGVGWRKYLYRLKMPWFIIKIPLSLIFNISRLKNPVDAIKRRFLDHL